MEELYEEELRTQREAEFGGNGKASNVGLPKRR